MNLSDFRSVLTANPGVALHVMLPDGDFVPAHFHITEVGRVQKDFIDCGGTVRSVTTCVLQIWVASDLDHRLNTTKLAGILKHADALMGAENPPVEVEYETNTTSVYPLIAAEVTPAGVLFHLGSKHTACLAPDRCGVGELGTTSCAAPGCC